MIKTAELLPHESENPADFAHRIGQIAALNKPAHLKQKLGQFFTPVEAARYMADFSTPDEKKDFLRILDPGTGCGVLSSAVIEKLANCSNVTGIELICYEIDEDILPYTELSLSYLKKWLVRSGIVFNYELRENDFITENKSIFSDALPSVLKHQDLFDIIISNPPFFKLRKDDIRLNSASSFISEQPNIYSFFIYIASHLLKDDGELIFLIPRSFCSGNFFRQFRAELLNKIKLSHIHLFSSESRLFESSSMLSGSVIIKGIKKTEAKTQYILSVSCSAECAGKPGFHYSFIFDEEANQIPLPESEKDVRILEIVSSWTGSLNKYNLQVHPGAAHKILPDRNYLLFRRYSTKHKDKRIIPIPYLAGETELSNTEAEKKLIYVDRPQSGLSSSEVSGLAAVFGSRFYNNYLRIINGNINLTIEEIGNLPLPRMETIMEIGGVISPGFKVQGPMSKNR